MPQVTKTQVTKRTKLSPTAISLLKEVREIILAEPKRLAMESWGQQREEGAKFYLPDLRDKSGETEKEFVAPQCGTTACIAGWTAIVGTPLCDLPTFKVGEKTFVQVEEIDNIELKAGELLGITPAQADALFLLPEMEVTKLNNLRAWPKRFSQVYLNAKTPKGRAKAAAEYISYVIRYGL